MGAKAQMFTPKGMKRDYSDSKASPDFSYENHNIRITSRGDTTLLSITNERGPKNYPITGLTQKVLTVNMEVNGSENTTTCTLSPYVSIKIVAENQSTGSSVLLDFTTRDTVQVSGDIRNSTLRVEDANYYDLSDQAIYVLDEFRTSSLINGVCIGHCVLNSFVTLFCTTRKTLDTSGTDYIIRLEENKGAFNMKVLYQGDLNLSQDHPIETLGIYETEDIQKVYWLDGVNQSRVINIAGSDYYFKRSLLINTPFDFIGDLNLQEQVTVERVDNSNGSFRAGVIQYAFTYYNRNGQESNIFYVTPLQYISYTDRGGSPEDVISCAFNLSIRPIDGNLYRSGEILRFTPTYDYLRVYAIYRSSLDATPEVRIVKDIDLNISGSIGYGSLGCSCVDLGAGELVDPSILLYLGGDPISFYTFAHKDNTLFLGNYKILRSTLQDLSCSADISFIGKSDIDYPSYNEYQNTLKYNSANISTFKGGETYRFGVQFQHKSGVWSEVIFLGDKENSMYPYKDSDTGVQLVGAQALLTGSGTSSDLVTSLRKLGYRKARGVVVFPSISDRTVIAQGALCPTVVNEIDAKTDSPSYQSSWFFRPTVTTETENTSLRSSVVFAHNAQIPSNKQLNSEIQVIDSDVPSNKTKFHVDQNIVTFHSPDILFDTNLWNLSYKDLKLRIIGYVVLNSSSSYATVNASGAYFAPTNPLSGWLQGFNYQSAFDGFSSNEPGMRNLHQFYLDNVTGPADSGGVTIPTGDNGTGTFEFVIYPWNNEKLTSQDDSFSTTTGRLSSQYRSQLFKGDTYYLSMGQFPSTIKEYSLLDTQIFSSEELSLLKISTRLGQKTYYGNINRVLTDNYKIRCIAKVPIIAGSFPYDPSEDNTTYTTSQDWTTDPELLGGTVYNFRGVQMKYKSTPHGVLSLQDYILPELGSEDSTKYVDTFYQDTIKVDVLSKVYLLLGELINTNVINRFGGTSPDAIIQNLWLPASKPIDLPTDSESITVEYTVGDTYFQRYDCLKTYAYDSNSMNNIIELLSFPCETRVNIDGRYDRNRDQLNNTAVSPTNFNLLNTVYSQKDNFFTYRTLDYNRFSQDYFPNSVTWTKTKTIGELIDSWTSISLASTLDLDGDKGALTALRRLNNEIYSFQPRGISRIFFNSRTQLLTNGVGSGSVPVEITNSGKVDGKAYISTGAGSSNKWSILPTPSSIYFIDDLTSSLQMLTGDSIADLSDKFAFRTWVEKVIDTEPWNPKDFNNVVSYYDPTNSDVYFVTNSGETTVCYSELLGQFSSFFDYDNIPAMFSVNGKLFSFKDNLLWEHEAGEYNNFFGQIKPYSIEVVSNLDAPIDKIYNTIEWRATIQEDGQDSTSTFDTVRVTTDGEYQDTGEVPILNKVSSPVGGILSKDSVSLRRKFRIWRIPIPRASSNKRDRMRGPWAHIKLAKNNPKKEKMELHDIVVHFFE